MWKSIHRVARATTREEQKRQSDCIIALLQQSDLRLNAYPRCEGHGKIFRAARADVFTAVFRHEGRASTSVAECATASSIQTS